MRHPELSMEEIDASDELTEAYNKGFNSAMDRVYLQQEDQHWLRTMATAAMQGLITTIPSNANEKQILSFMHHLPDGCIKLATALLEEIKRKEAEGNE
jgi:hypothetical protein